MRQMMMLLAAMLFVSCSSEENEVMAQTRQEKGFSLPTSNEQVNAQPGDIVLYNGSNICMFYGTNSWSYTRLGHIDGLSESELRTFLHAGENNINVTLSLSNATGISQVKTDEAKSKAYTLQGTLAQAGHKGIIIKNGRKIVR